jgi:hypothetical protein
MKIANRDARQFVQKQHPFEGNNIYAQFHTVNHPNGENGPGMWYAVYSYGDHWPLFIHANDTWFENEEKYSKPTTNKHRTQTHPHCPTVLLSKAWMLRLAKGGYAAIAQERILRGEPA